MSSKKQTIHSFAQDTIDRLIKPPINWPREIKLFKNLWKIYPNKVLWASIEIKLVTLAFFLTDNGKDYIRKTLQAINFEPIKPNKVILGEEIIGENRKVEKPLSIKEFLNK